jgi:hypothetical protein
MRKKEEKTQRGYERGWIMGWKGKLLFAFKGHRCE